MGAEREIEKTIFNTFSAVASSIGYSPLHGNIIGVLLVKDRPVSLQELAEGTGYSASMVSLSLDFLEVLGIIKKVKKEGDRKLYISLSGDLLECLKKAIVMKVDKSVQDFLSEFDGAKRKLERIGGNEAKNTLKTITILESQIKRLNRYIRLLSEIRLP